MILNKKNKIGFFFSILSSLTFLLTSCFNTEFLFNQRNELNNVKDLTKTSQSEQILIQNFQKNQTVIEENNPNLQNFQYDLIPILEAARLEKFNNIHIPNYQTEQQQNIAKNLFSRTISITANLVEKNNSADNFFIIPTRNFWWQIPTTPIIRAGRKVISTFSGTGWIIAKTNNDARSHSYYVATNIHVASAFAKLKFEQSKIENAFIDYTFSPAPYINFESDNNFQLPTSTTIANTNLSVLNLNNENDERNNNLSYLPLNIDPNFYWTPENLDLRQWNNKNVIASYNSLDLAVLKMDFAPSFNSNNNYFINSKKRTNIQNFVQSLQKIEDIKFAITEPEKDVLGYIAGAPGLNPKNDFNVDYKNKYQYNNGFYNLIIGANHQEFRYIPSKKPQFDLENECLDLEKRNFQGQTICLNSTGYSFNVPYLNALPGSSGSIFINNQNEIQGIYWGIVYPKDSGTDFNNMTWGQIVALRVKNHYDVIKKNDDKIGFENNKTKTLCEVIENDSPQKTFSFCQ